MMRKVYKIAATSVLMRLPPFLIKKLNFGSRCCYFTYQFFRQWHGRLWTGLANKDSLDLSLAS